MKIRYLELLAFLVSINCSGFGQTIFSQETKTYFDSTRQRKLITEIWIPQNNNAASFPLVMFSHGTGGNRLACSWFCKGLADKGFIVAAVDHFGNTYDNPIPKEFVTIWQRPQDISFVLSELLNEKNIAAKLDNSKVYMAGFSIGGYTSLALAGAKIDWDNVIRFTHTPQGFKEINVPEMPGLISMFEQDIILEEFNKSPDLLDKRFKAVFVMSPAAGQGFSSKKQMKRIKVPVFIVGAESDNIAPIRTNALHYKKLLPKSELYILKNKVGHYVFLNEGTVEMKSAAPIFFQDAEGINRNEIHRQIISLAEIFFNKIK